MSNKVDFKCIHLIDSINLGTKMGIGKKNEINFIFIFVY